MNQNHGPMLNNSKSDKRNLFKQEQQKTEISLKTGFTHFLHIDIPRFLLWGIMLPKAEKMSRKKGYKIFHRIT